MNFKDYCESGNMNAKKSSVFDTQLKPLLTEKPSARGMYEVRRSPERDMLIRTLKDKRR